MTIPKKMLAAALALMCAAPLAAEPSDDSFNDRFVSRLQNMQSHTGAVNDLSTALGANSPLPATFNLLVKCEELWTRLVSGDFKNVAVDGLQTLGEYGLEKAAEVYSAAKAVNVVYACAKLGRYVGENYRAWQQDMVVETAYRDYAGQGGWTHGGGDVTGAMHFDRLSKVGLTEPTGRQDAQGRSVQQLKPWVARYFKERYALEQQARNTGADQVRQDVATAKKEIFKQALPKIFPGLGSGSAGRLAALIADGQVTKQAVLGIVPERELEAMAAAGPVKQLKKDPGSGGGRQTGRLDEVLAYLESRKAQLAAGALLFGTYADNVGGAVLDRKRAYREESQWRADTAKLEAARRQDLESLISMLKGSGFPGLIDRINENGGAALKKTRALESAAYAAGKKQTSRHAVNSLAIDWDAVRQELFERPDAARGRYGNMIQADAKIIQGELDAFKKLLSETQAIAEIPEGKQLAGQAVEAAKKSPGVVSVYFRDKRPKTPAELNGLLETVTGGRPLSGRQPGGRTRELDAAVYAQAALVNTLNEHIAGRAALIAALESARAQLILLYDTARQAIPIARESKKLYDEAQRLAGELETGLEIHADYLDGKGYRLGDGFTFKGTSYRLPPHLTKPDYPYDYDSLKKSETYNGNIDEGGTSILETNIAIIKHTLSGADAIPAGYVEGYRAKYRELAANIDEFREECARLGYPSAVPYDISDDEYAFMGTEMKLKVLYPFIEQLRKALPGWESRLTDWKSLMSRLKARDAKSREKAGQLAKKEADKKPPLPEPPATVVPAALVRPAGQNAANAAASGVLEEVHALFKKAEGDRRSMDRPKLQLAYNRARRAVEKAGAANLDGHNAELNRAISFLHHHLLGSDDYETIMQQLPEFKKLTVQGRRWNELDGALTLLRDDLIDGRVEIRGTGGKGFNEFFRNSVSIGRTRVEVNTGTGWQSASADKKDFTYRFVPVPGEQTLTVRAVNPGGAVSDPFDVPPLRLTYRDAPARDVLQDKLAALAQHFEQKNITLFMNEVSEDFYGGRDVLRDNLRRFFDAVSAVRLHVVPDSCQSTKARRLLTAHWEKSFAANATGTQYNQAGNTTFTFDAASGKLLGMKGDSLFVPVSDSVTVDQLLAGTTRGTDGSRQRLPAGQSSLENEYTTQLGFRFDSGMTVSVLQADLWWNTDGIAASYHGGIRDLGLASLEDIENVPAEGYGIESLSADAGRVYAVKTESGKYGLVEITAVNGTTSIQFRWKYQPDGSTMFW